MKVSPTLFSEHVPCQRGDIWQLGEHRLCCGDSTNAEDVSRLFAGNKFSLCFTSPPYSNQRTYKIGMFDWYALMCGAFDQMIVRGEPDCHILVNLGLCHKNRRVDLYWMGWVQHCADVDWPLFGWYVWDQGTGLPGEWGGRLAPSHEFLFHFNRKLNYPQKWIATKDESRKPRIHKTSLRRDHKVETVNSPHMFGQDYKIPDSVIRVNRECARGLHTVHHPAVFPVALPEFIMQTWSQSGDIVYEPFCGSGTSIIAGENLGRRVYAMEIEPTYCDLAIQRWQEHTGQQAIRVEVSA